MTEQEYKKLLIAAVKAGDNQDRDIIVSLLQFITIRFEKNR